LDTIYYEAPSSVYHPIKGMGKLHSISQTPEIKEKYCCYEFEDGSRMDTKRRNNVFK
jgi:hypothetical protein